MRNRLRLGLRVGADVDVDRRVGSPLFLVPVALLLVFASLPIAAAASTNVSVHMLGEPGRLNLDGEPVLVAGIWHEIQVNLTGPAQSSVTVALSLPAGPSRDVRSDYHWFWNVSTGAWSDSYYATFIRDDLSSTDGTRFSFVVGVDAQATPGLWNLQVLHGSTQLVAMAIEVASPSLAYALSAADFTFQVEPFQAADVSSAAGQYIRAINSGNLPLRASLSFNVLQDKLSLVDPGAIAHPGTDARYYLHLVLDSRPPQIIHVDGVSRVTVANLIPSAGSAQLVPSVEQAFEVRVFVGRAGYAVKEVGGVVFQTLESIHVDYGAKAIWQVYLTGSQSVSFSVAASNGRFIGAFSGSQALAMPATLVLSPVSEYPVTVQVEANQPGTATVTFTLRLLDTGDVQTFTTTILVAGGPPPSSASTVTYLWIAGSLATAVVFGLVSFSQLRHRRGGTVTRAGSAGSELKEKRGYNYRRRMRSQRGRNRANGNGPKGTSSPSRDSRTPRHR